VKRRHIRRLVILVILRRLTPVFAWNPFPALALHLLDRRRDQLFPADLPPAVGDRRDPGLDLEGHSSVAL